MSENLYIIFLEDKNKLTLDVIKRHVQHLKKLDEDRILVLCGPFVDTTGGMIVLNVPTLLQANNIAKQDPFVAEGFKTYRIQTLDWAKKDNNYGLN